MGEKFEEDEQKKSKSSTSSPTHEFSFTISVLHQAKSSPSKAYVDLSPADDIFFHGHLLPLRLLAHLPLSPRSSTNSLENDTFTLPIEEDPKPNETSTSTSSSNSNDRKEILKSKSFSFFGRRSKRRKGSFEVREKEEQREKRKRKLSFNMSHVIKRYMRMVSPLLFFRGKRSSEDAQLRLRRKPYSFSGYFSPRGKKEHIRGRRGEFSAPVSMWTSPTNSGPLVANGSNSSGKSDSTMEELQAAIQAAITHCKNSIAMDEKNQI